MIMLVQAAAIDVTQHCSAPAFECSAGLHKLSAWVLHTAYAGCPKQAGYIADNVNDACVLGGSE